MLHLRYILKKIFAPGRAVFREARSAEDLYYHELVTETAKKIVKKKDPNVEAREIIENVYAREKAHIEKFEQFKRVVMRRVAEMEQKAKTEREQKIIKKHKDTIEDIAAGILRPAGVKEGFKIRVRVGNIYERIVGTGFDAKELHKEMHEVQTFEDGIQEKRIDLEAMKAAKAAAEDSKGLAAAIRNAIGVGRIRGRFQAREFKAEHKEEYGKDKEKKLLKELSEQEKKLEDKKKRLEAVLKHVEDLRTAGREAFAKTPYKAKLDVYLQHKNEMDEDVFNERVEEIRQQVRRRGDKLGIVYFEYFLNEKLGIKPVEKHEAEVYRKPQTPKETLKEKAMVSKWYKKTFAKEGEDSAVAGLIEALRKDQPEYLTSILQDTADQKRDMLLKFFFTGEIEGGKGTLDAGRRLAMTPENIVRMLRLSKEYTVDKDKLVTVLETFAHEWTESKAEDFDGAYELILDEEIYRETKKKLATLWSDLTDETVAADDERVTNLYKHIRTKISGSADRRKFYETFLNSAKHRNLMKFFFKGEFRGISLVSEKGKLFQPTVENVYTVFTDQVNEIAKTAASEDQTETIFKQFAGSVVFDAEGLKGLTRSEFDRLYALATRRVRFHI